MRDRADAALQVLEAGREIIADPERWNRNGHFRDETRTRCCAVGALLYNRLVEDDPRGYPTEPAHVVLYDAYRELHPDDAAKLGSITIWNDQHATHAEVIEVFDRAIELARDGHS